MQSVKTLLLLTAVIFSQIALSDDEIPTTKLAQDITYLNAKVSPNGKYIAILIKEDGKRNIGIITTKDLKQVGGAALSGNQEFGDFTWANNTRLVATVWEKLAWQDQAENYGELFAVNYDGSGAKLIYGYGNQEKTTGTLVKKRKGIDGWAKIIDKLPDDDMNILISSTPWSDDKGRLATVYKLNVYNGHLSSPILHAPVPFADFVVDNNDHIRMVTGTNKNGDIEVYNLTADKQWQQISSAKLGNLFAALAMDDSNRYLYYLDDLHTDKIALNKLDTQTGKSSLIYQDPNVDISSVNISQHHQPYAALVNDGVPNYVMFNHKGDEAKLFKSLLSVLPGYKLTITSESKDGNLWTIIASNATSPADFYLFNHNKMQLTPLFRDMNNINVKKLSSPKPVSFQAKDGATLHGYLTYPIHHKNTVPLVTLVHGGPHGVRDTWSFDSEVQLLASHGFAVMQVNYRGSGGYGKKFLSAGYKHWGDLIISDIVDATEWASKQSGIDGKHKCIMGGSFGGYASVLSAERAPTLFNCVVASSGVYNLNTFIHEGDSSKLLFGPSDLKLYLGDDMKQLAEFSPINHVDSLKAAILISHGERDQRVPFDQAKELKAALDKIHKHYQWYSVASETHGFYSPKNRKIYYDKVLKFLDNNI